MKKLLISLRRAVQGGNMIIFEMSVKPLRELAWPIEAVHGTRQQPDGFASKTTEFAEL